MLFGATDWCQALNAFPPFMPGRSARVADALRGIVGSDDGAGWWRAAEARTTPDPAGSSPSMRSLGCSGAKYLADLGRKVDKPWLGLVEGGEDRLSQLPRTFRGGVQLPGHVPDHRVSVWKPDVVEHGGRVTRSVGKDCRETLPT